MRAMLRAPKKRQPAKKKKKEVVKAPIPDPTTPVPKKVVISKSLSKFCRRY